MCVCVCACVCVCVRACVRVHVYAYTRDGTRCMSLASARASEAGTSEGDRGVSIRPHAGADVAWPLSAAPKAAVCVCVCIHIYL